MTVFELLIASTNALFLLNFTFILKVQTVLSPYNLLLSKPDISSKAGALTFRNVLFFGLGIPLFTGNTGFDPFKILDLRSLMLNSASNSMKF